MGGTVQGREVVIKDSKSDSNLIYAAVRNNARFNQRSNHCIHIDRYITLYSEKNTQNYDVDQLYHSFSILSPSRTRG